LPHFKYRSQHAVGFSDAIGKKMTKLKLLSAALVAALMLATPAMARPSHATSQYFQEETGRASPTDRHIVGHVDIPAHVSVPATPPDGENCDVGENAFIC
jgi:hypothetical protein